MKVPIRKKYCLVYLLDANISFDQAYIYRSEFAEKLYLGQLVEVPFGKGNSLRRAVIIDQTNQSEFADIKHIAKVISQEPIYMPDQIQLAFEMKRRYFCTMGQALKTISPPTVIKVGKKTSRACRLTDPAEALDLLKADAFSSIQQQRVVEMLLTAEEALVSEITQGCQVSESVLKTLSGKNIIEFFKMSIDRTEEEIPIWQEKQITELNNDQEKAIATVLESRKTKQPLNEHLLYGITGSGKTEVYLRLADKTIAQGKSVIILVPEISLTPLMISRFLSKFDDQVAIWHSRLTLTQRFEQWQKIMRQDKKIVVGARSAIFSPLAEIGLIIIDEEQESSYISDTMPRYKAHEIARIRAIQHHAVLVLGSATPSVETYYRTVIGKANLLRLPKRAKPAPLPKVSLIQMKHEFSREDFDTVFSKALLENLQTTFQSGGQAMLFLNRRGLTSAIQCTDCGHVLYCPHCEIPLTRHVNRYNRNKYKLICHYCGYMENEQDTCPECGSKNLLNTGIGTQKVEETFQKHFPGYKALRMDFDTMIGQHAHREALSAFRSGKYQCLIGTQMIAKGHDFPNVRTVGIIAVDSLLYTGNYKAEERAFQLITQAAGRSGRSDQQGDVFIQGYNLDHYAIRNAAQQDYLAFYQEETEFRKRAGFPPFLELGMVLIQSYHYQKANREADVIYQNLNSLIHQYQTYFTDTIIYPPMMITKLRNRFRFRIMIKSKEKIKIANLFQNELKRNKDPDVSIYLDINPEHVL